MPTVVLSGTKIWAHTPQPLPWLAVQLRKTIPQVNTGNNRNWQRARRDKGTIAAEGTKQVWEGGTAEQGAKLPRGCQMANVAWQEELPMREVCVCVECACVCACVYMRERQCGGRGWKIGGRTLQSRGKSNGPTLSYPDEGAVSPVLWCEDRPEGSAVKWVAWAGWQAPDQAVMCRSHYRFWIFS